ncbi:hypothetical protein GPECTOR_59g658 [Gonium pectorale]|uniref:Uncharacterized protein n=1 Tax=Gonium pectorale TaxID=33097 RepID=A0A150G6T5_GONPE|nr:hypothetical protein GPECTOR_59g658 [Gonium pectorale]|eukprot:KXZ45050.1 hypothetical protein GPECTOR_59g658 [Gonium pectorale]
MHEAAERWPEPGRPELALPQLGGSEIEELQKEVAQLRVFEQQGARVNGALRQDAERWEAAYRAERDAKLRSRERQATLTAENTRLRSQLQAAVRDTNDAQEERRRLQAEKESMAKAIQDNQRQRQQLETSLASAEAHREAAEAEVEETHADLRRKNARLQAALVRRAATIREHGSLTTAMEEVCFALLEAAGVEPVSAAEMSRWGSRRYSAQAFPQTLTGMRVQDQAFHVASAGEATRFVERWATTILRRPGVQAAVEAAREEVGEEVFQSWAE